MRLSSWSTSDFMGLDMKFTEKQQFVCGEVFVAAWGASVQHASLYNAKPKTKARDAFRAKIERHIFSEIIPQYLASQFDEEAHIANIAKLCEFGSAKGRGLLRRRGYKFGVAQKLLNLLLKYLWCLGRIPEPPHCPVDSIIIGKTRLKGTVKWTKIVSHAEYRKVIAVIKEVADEKGLSIAQWELREFARRSAIP